MGYEDYDDGATSKFNAGLLQMARIHKLQDRINEASFNPLATDERYASPNYKIILSCANSLYREIIHKLSDDEKEEIDKLRSTIELFELENPIYQNKRAYPQFRTKITLDQEVWNVLWKSIRKYTERITALLDIHGFNSPSEDDFGDLD